MQSNTLNDSAAGPYKVNSLHIDPGADPMSGVVTWDPARSLWNGGMLIAAVVLAPRYFTWGAFGLLSPVLMGEELVEEDLSAMATARCRGFGLVGSYVGSR